MDTITYPPLSALLGRLSACRRLTSMQEYFIVVRDNGRALLHC